MNKLSKVMAVFTAVALLATGPGAGPMALFAQTSLGQGAKIVNTSVNTGNLSGSRANLGGSRMDLKTSQGIGVKGALGLDGSGKPVVLQTERVASERVAIPRITVITELGDMLEVTPAAISDHDVPFQSVGGFGLPLPYKGLITGQQGEGKNSASERVGAPVERDIHQGKVTFDGADKNLTGDQTTVSFEGTGGNGTSGLKPSQDEQASGGGQVPAAPAAPTSAEKTKKLSTFLDTAVVAGLATVIQVFTNSWEASLATAYAAMAFIGRYRYSEDFMKVKSDEKYGKLGGAARFGLLSLMTMVAAPVAFTVEIYQQLVKPFVKAVWNAIKNIARAIKNAAVWVYENILTPIGHAIRDFFKAAWEMVKAFGRAVRELFVNFVQAVKDAAKWVYENVLTPIGHAIRDFFKAAWELIKDFARFVSEMFANLVEALQDAAKWVYEAVLTPIGHAIRGVSAAVIAGVVAGLAVTVPFLGSMSVKIIVKPLHEVFDQIGKMPIAFRIPARVFVPMALVLLGIVALPAFATLTVVGGFLVGAFGAFFTGLKEGYGSGFYEGIAKGIGDAWKLATGKYSTAKASYVDWRMKLTK